MQCNCLEELRSRLKDHVAETIKSPVDSVECENAGFTLGESLNTAIFLNFNVRADAPGYRTMKGKQIRVHVSHCPFCGTPAKADKADA